AHRLERFDGCLARRADLIALRLDCRFELGELRAERLRGLLSTSDVLALLENPPGSAGGSGRATERGRAHRLPAEDCADQRRADRDRGLYALVRDLLGLALDRLLRTADALLEGGNLRRILVAELGHGLIALLAARLPDARSKVRLGFSRLRDGF